ncbi:MAG: LamB/YcsF family protein [bacterium]
MAKQIDINSDMGEGFGLYKVGDDAKIMEHITTANVACGFHAGDSSVMRQTVKLAKKNDVAVGAHPGFPDLQGFGRREMKLSPQEIKDIITYQAGALKAFVEAAGMKLHHVKPHGSLYGLAVREETIFRAVAEAIQEIDPNLTLYIMRQGVVPKLAESMGLRVVYELYADLDYDGQGNLVISRTHKPADPKAIAAKCLRMVKDGKVRTLDGTDIDIQGTSICVHSDTPGAPDTLKELRRILSQEGYEIKSP